MARWLRAQLFFLFTAVVLFPVAASASGTFSVTQGGSKTIVWTVSGDTGCTGAASTYPTTGDTVYSTWVQWHPGSGNTGPIKFLASPSSYAFTCTSPSNVGDTATLNIAAVPPPTGVSATCNTTTGVVTINGTATSLSGATYPVRAHDTSGTGTLNYTYVNGNCVGNSGDYCNDLGTGFPQTFQGTLGHTYNIWVQTLWNGAWSASAVVSPNVSCTATYTITASAGTGGSISPSGSVSVTQGSSKSFTITANSGYVISSVTVDGVSQGAISTYTFSNVTANHTISASFAAAITCPANQTLTWSSCSGTTVSTTAPGSATVSNTATGYSGSATFSCNANGTWNTTPTSSTCNAVYTIQSSAGTGGKISPSGTSQVTSGGSKSYSITANSGYTISDVAVDGVSQGAISSYTFSNVTTNHTISATFASATTYNISASAGAGGTINPSGTVSVVQGNSQTFTITANSGYTILAVTVDSVSQGAISTYTFSNVTAAHTISATFQAAATTGCANNKDASGVALTLSAGTYTQTSPSGEYKNTNTTSNSGGNYCWGNSGANTYFVPQNTAAEFNSFWTALQGGTLTGLSIIN